MVLLGVVKYLYRDLLARLKESQKIELFGRWASFSTDGLNCAKISPATFVRYHGSMVGKEFKVVLQAAPFVFFQFLTEEQRHLWSILGHLGSYMFQTKISDKRAYLLNLEILVDLFCYQSSQSLGNGATSPNSIC